MKLNNNNGYYSFLLNVIVNDYFFVKVIIMFNKYSYISFEEIKNIWFLKSFFD